MATHTEDYSRQVHADDADLHLAPRHRPVRWLWPEYGKAFVLVHVITVAGALWAGVTWQAVLWGVVQYVATMFFVTAALHRYFSHRAFKTSRAFQFVLAWCAQCSAQMSVLWWASHHRHHHRYSDKEEDVHSPRRRGLAYAHMGWLLTADGHGPYKGIADLQRFPELRFLDRWRLLPATCLGVLSWLLLGWPGLFSGFFVALVLSWHATFTINSLAHVIGTPRYDTGDDSKNSLLLALVTLGEGWHNNHHRYMRSARQGFAWWEVDITYYGIKLLELLRLVWEVREPPLEIMAVAREG